MAASLNAPNLAKYNPFMGFRAAKVVVRSENGKIPVIEMEGQQTVKGTLSGETKGAGIPAAGPDLGKADLPALQGEKKGEQIERKARTGVRINFVNEPSNTKETWITPEALVINVGHPVYVRCSSLGYSTELINMLRCVYMELIANRPPDTVAEAMDDMRQFFMQWSNVQS